MTVYGYTRVSTDEQVIGTSLETQRPEIAGVAMSNHMEVDEWIVDAGVSGTLPFFERLGAHGIVIGKGDVIICAKLDRFNRNPADCLSVVQSLKKIGVKLFINGHGDVTDPANPLAEFMFQMLACFAGYYAADLRHKNITGKRAKKQRGGYNGGTVPHGYRVQGSGRASTLVPLAEEQNMIEFINDLASKTNVRGRPFSSRDVQKMTQGKFPELRVPSHTTINKMLNEVRHGGG